MWFKHQLTKESRVDLRICLPCSARQRPENVHLIKVFQNINPLTSEDEKTE